MDMTIQESYINARYHLAVAKRLFENYSKFSEKRLIVGVINELARATSNVIKAYLIFERKKKLRDFVDSVGIKHLDKLTIDNLLKVLEIERAQKMSPIEFTKDSKIILLVNNKYRVLTADRLSDFMTSCDEAIRRFSSIFRQV